MNRAGFHKATRVKILLKLKTSISDSDLNPIATAPQFCLPVKHSMFHRQTQLQRSGNKTEWDIQRWNLEIEHDLDSRHFVKARPVADHGIP